VEPGQPALAEIAEKFGSTMVQPGGQLDRAQLARLVFANASARSALEAILHPRIRAVWSAEADAWRKAGLHAGAVVVPLLFETGAAPLFDAVICAACPPATQTRRLRERGWDSAQIQQRLDAQWPSEKKTAHSDFVVWTDTPLQIHAAQLARILDSAGS
jgi:dephospho-CoA kinase